MTRPLLLALATLLDRWMHGHFEELLRLAQNGIGVPQVETHALEEVPTLFEKLRRGEILGRAVVRMPAV